MTIKEHRKAFLFVTLTFAISYLLIFFYFLFGGKWVMPGSLIISIIYMFIPMLVSIFVQKIVYKDLVKEPLGVSFKLNRWFLIASLLPVIISFLPWELINSFLWLNLLRIWKAFMKALKLPLLRTDGGNESTD